MALGLVSPRAAFGFRDFRLYQTARFFTTVATQMQSVAVGWEVYDLTKRAMSLGFVGLVQFLPAVGLSLVTGAVADRFDRKRIVVVCQLAFVLCSLLLYGRSAGGGHDEVPIYGALFAFGVTRAFTGPASQALMPSLVPAEHFGSAVAWSSTVWEIAAVAGPALGGIIYGATGGAASVYLACAGLYACGAAVLLAIRTRSERMTAGATSLSTLLAGIRYVIEKRVILGSISLDLFAVLFGGATALLPVFARDILFVGPRGLGLLRSAPAIGAAATALYIAYRPLRRRAGAVMLTCVAVFGLMTIVFGLSRSFWLSVAALVVLGASDMVSVVVRQTLVQLRTPPAMRGRVSAVNLVFIGASNELGEMESGLTAAWMGAVPAVVMGGVGACIVVALWAVLFPSLRKVDRLSPADEEPLTG